MTCHHPLTIRARTLLSQTAVLDVALLETLNLIVKEKVYALESCDSLHTYCVKRLGMSDDSVARRRRAAKLLERYPHIVTRLIERREIHLTGLAALYAAITDENAERLFDEARGKTKYEIELMVARENPKPALTSAVTRVPDRARPTEEKDQDATDRRRSSQAASPLDEHFVESPLSNANTAKEDAPSAATERCSDLNSDSRVSGRANNLIARGPQLALTATTQPGPLQKTAPVRSDAEAALPRAKPLEIRGPDIFQFRAMMTAETKKILDEVLDLGVDRDLNAVLRDALDALRTDLRVRKRAALRRKVVAEVVRDHGTQEPARQSFIADDADRAHVARGVTDSVVQEAPCEPGMLANAQDADAGDRVVGMDGDRSDSGDELVGPSADQRHIPAAVRRSVYERDNHQCQFINRETGERCCTTSNLHLHHIIAWAKGGPTTTENLTVLCRTHNLYEGEREFGPLNRITPAGRRARTTEVDPSRA